MFSRLFRAFQKPTDPAGHVYYARLNTPQGIFYKIGYTKKNSLTKRLAYAGLGDEKMIERELLFIYCYNAWDVEQYLHEHFRKQRAFNWFSGGAKQPLYKRGQSELYRSDILGLDEVLYAPRKEAQHLHSAPTDNQMGGCLIAIVCLLGLALTPFSFGGSLVLAFFVIAGFSEFFQPSKKQARTVVIERAPRPVHPPQIQALIESLCSPIVNKEAST